MTVEHRPANIIDAVHADVLALLLGETHDWCEPTAPCWHDPFRPIRDSWLSATAVQTVTALPRCDEGAQSLRAEANFAASPYGPALN
jgi:hypothetical protein